MWPKRSHILSPLTELMGSKEYKWGPLQEKAFKKMKAVISKDMLLAYAEHNKKLYIKTDASDYQLGSRIFQKEYRQEDNKTVERDISLYTRKLNSAQKNYSTIEKKLQLSKS